MADSQRPGHPAVCETIVVLVHGTFAPGAEWTRPFSPLVRAVQGAVDPNRTLVIPFGWSGQNNHRERLGASRGLIQLITDLKRFHPNARFILIGHSHGGNICLHASKNPAVAHGVAGIICLATPFLLFKDRGGSIDLHRWVFAILSSMLAMFAIGYFPYGHHGGLVTLLAGANALDHGWIRWPAVLGTLLLFPIAFVATFAGAARIFVVVSDSLENLTRYPRILARRLRLPQQLAAPVLSVRYRGDEAALWLRLVARVGSLPLLIANVAAVGLILGGLLWLATFVVLFLLPFRSAVIPVIQPYYLNAITHVWAPLFVTWLGSALCVTAVALFLSGRFFGFGSYVRGTAMLVGVRGSVEAPKGLNSTNLVLAPLDAIRRIKEEAQTRLLPWPGVIHTLAYRDPLAIGQISDWVRAAIAPIETFRTHP
jgi:hypothetical protein